MYIPDRILHLKNKYPNSNQLEYYSDLSDIFHFGDLKRHKYTKTTYLRTRSRRGSYNPELGTKLRTKL